MALSDTIGYVAIFMIIISIFIISRHEKFEAWTTQQQGFNKYSYKPTPEPTISLNQSIRQYVDRFESGAEKQDQLLPMSIVGLTNTRNRSGNYPYQSWPAPAYQMRELRRKYLESEERMKLADAGLIPIPANAPQLWDHGFVLQSDQN